MMSVTRRQLLPLLLTLVIIGLFSSQGWGEPMMIIGFGPRVDSTKEILFPQEQPKGITLLRVGPRVGLSGKSPIGKDQKEDFHQYDIAATFGLPWGWQHRTTGMRFDLRLLTSAGQLA